MDESRGDINGELSMVDMNSINAIAGFLRALGYGDLSEVLIGIQYRATRLIEKAKEQDNVFEFSKTVKVTNMKNVLVQIPRAVVSDWGLRVGDEVELKYQDGKVTITPAVQRRRCLTGQSN